MSVNKHIPDAERKCILMLGTAFDTKGGIAAVVSEYSRAGLFERFPVVYLATHTDGSQLTKFGAFVGAWWRCMVFLAGRKVALVHVHAASDASFWRKALFLAPAFIAGVPTVLHLHGAEFAQFYEYRCGSIARWMVRAIFDRANTVVVLSDWWRNWVHSIAPNARALSIPNPVAMKQVDWDGPREVSTILFLGRLGQRKGSYDLLHALRRLAPRHPQVRLVLGGDGELDGTRHEAQRQGIAERVEIAGWITGQRKEELLRRATVYALPSYAEGLPVSLLEAMAAGLPVISTPVGGIPELLQEDIQGIMILPGDIDALTRALDRLLSDQALRQRMGQAARERIAALYSSERILPRLERLYEELTRLPAASSVVTGSAAVTATTAATTPAIVVTGDCTTALVSPPVLPAAVRETHPETGK